MAENNQIMVGWILYNAEGRKLTRGQNWSTRTESGWLWSDAEAIAVIELMAYMQQEDLPVFCQWCELVREEDGDVNVYALAEVLRIEEGE